MKENSDIRVIVVDDEHSIRKSLVDFLEDYDYDVIAAGSAEEALRLLQQEIRDVGVVDLRLPGISGDEMIARAYQLYPHMRFIIHTGSVTYHIPQELEKIGMRQEHVFFKPVSDLHQIVDAINAVVNGRPFSHV